MGIRYIEKARLLDSLLVQTVVLHNIIRYLCLLSSVHVIYSIMPVPLIFSAQLWTSSKEKESQSQHNGKPRSTVILMHVCREMGLNIIH